MRQDPMQPLADIGRRVLQTARYLATPPVLDNPLVSYESQLRDPVVALSDVCGELLERLAAPGAVEPENLSLEPEIRPVPAPNPGSASPAFSRAGAAAKFPVEASYEGADLGGENRATPWPDTPGPNLEGAPAREVSPRTLEAPAPFTEGPSSREPRETAAREPGAGSPQPDSPAVLGPVADGPNLYPADRQMARRVPSPRNVQHPVERSPAERLPTGEHLVGPGGEPSPKDLGSETRPFAGSKPSETRRTELPSDARAEDGPARGVGESEDPFPLRGSRLTGSTERLAAMLSAQLAQPEPVTRTAGKESREDEGVFPGRQGDEERNGSSTEDEPAPMRSGGPVGVEEIMERLADELETEFVRTYGRSGG